MCQRSERRLSIAWLNTEKQIGEVEAGARLKDEYGEESASYVASKKRGRIFTTARYHPGFFILGRLGT